MKDKDILHFDSDQKNVYVSSQVSVMTHSILMHVIEAMGRIMA